MAEYSQRQTKSQRSLMASALVWFIVGPPQILGLLAFLCSWPLGPRFVDEGGITKLRLAVASIAMSLIFIYCTLVPLLLRTMRQVDNMCTRLLKSVDEQERTSASSSV
jgi:hypothetical protein